MELIIALTLVIAVVVLAFCMLRRRNSDASTPQQESRELRVSQGGRSKNTAAVDPTAANEVGETAVQDGDRAEDAVADRDRLADKEESKGVMQNVQLIAGLHRVFEEEKIFLRPDIHIEDVAKMLLTNRTYVTRLMRQEYGLSFIEYVNIARIQHSQSLLYSSNMTLDEVAERSGFQSTSNYCRAFKRYIGTTPLAWKNSVPKN